MAVIIIAAAYFTVSGTGSNQITIIGSTTVQPVAQTLAQAYMEKHPDVKITVQSGRANIGTASRNLTAQESAGLTQYPIGKDGIAIIVNPQNPVKSLTTNQLTDIFSGKITNWNQVGGKDEPIKVIIRETGSGTRLALETILFGKETSDLSGAVVGISTYQVMQDVAVSPNAIGYVSRNALTQQVKIIEVNNIPLTKENVDNGTYILQRPLLFLVKGNATGIVKDFIDFSLSPEGQAIINTTEYKSTASNNVDIAVGPSGGI
jgi:phosphate transport system substrate-binding protein